MGVLETTRIPVWLLIVEQTMSCPRELRSHGARTVGFEDPIFTI
jgi:hypothetical protein